ncbi:MAG: GNAT family N-acetyltransferase [Pseudomonadota bacterium]
MNSSSETQHRLIHSSDKELLRFYFQSNYQHFKVWQPARSLNYYSNENWNTIFEQWLTEQEEGRAVHFIAYHEQQLCIAGHCSLTQISYGPFKACYMGYGIALEQQGKNQAYYLCQSTINHAFQYLKLHRIMANYMPHNNRSGKLLKRLGFEKEGFARNYLKINGQWRNHFLMVKNNETR